MSAPRPLLEPDPPVTVRRPVMTMRWDLLTFIHWRLPVDAVQRLLPDGLRASTFDGSAWVGLVPFLMDVSFPVIGGIPGLSVFPETNVRTYVEAEDGSQGIWFFSLDADRASAVMAARLGYRLPYMWSAMAIDTRPGRVTYTARRRWPGPRGTQSILSVRPGELIDSPDPLEHFLTARWGLFTQLRSRLAYAPVDHPAWPLQRADLAYLDDELVEAAGYPAPAGTPLVHYSDGVEVRIGLPRKVADA